MWLELILAAVVSADPGSTSSAGSAWLPPAVAARQTAFGIPFRIDRKARPEAEAVEVQLYVSADRGATWRLHGRVDPRQGVFPFRADGDGEYWFSIRTLDRSGQLRPQGNPRPGLRVVVDTTPPKLVLEAQAADGGRIATRWQIEDAYLKPDSLKLQFRTGPTQPWQPVAIDPATQTRGATQTGQASWLTAAGSGRVEVRAEATDIAGNPAVSHAQVDLGVRGPTASAVGLHGPGVGPELAPAAPTDWQAARPAGAPPVSGSVAGTTGTAAAAAGRIGTTTQWASSQIAGGPAEGGVARGTPPGPSQPGDGPVSIQLNPPMRRQYLPAAASGLGALPPGVRPRLVNTRVFELEYHIDSVGPSGIAKVELWGTRDGGRTWTSFGEDADRLSPMVVTVHDEGLYGFCVAVQNGVGLGGDPPKPGTPADLWILVDLTKPTVRLLSAELGVGEQLGKLLVRWDARDLMLAARPLSLSYSDLRGGPWTPIVAGLENTGQYNWTIDGRVPERIYLRVEARDEAGNVGIYETPEPVLLDRLRPNVHIRDVRPVGQSPRGTQRF